MTSLGLHFFEGAWNHQGIELRKLSALAARVKGLTGLNKLKIDYNYFQIVKSSKLGHYFHETSTNTQNYIIFALHKMLSHVEIGPRHFIAIRSKELSG